MEESVGRLLTARRQTLAVAESCTGGMLAERLTRAPGSSAYFVEGRITYADAAKRRLLGVPAGILKRNGAVSRECALAMVRGLRLRAKTDWALSVTGIAGPGGGSPAKPVGLVFIGLAGPGTSGVWENRFTGGRAAVRRASVRRALGLLMRGLGGKKKGGG